MTGAAHRPHLDADADPAGAAGARTQTGAHEAHRRIFAVASPSVDADVGAHINHSGVLLEPGQHSGAARLAGRTCASIVVRLNAAALKAIASPVIHRIRSTRLVSRRPIHDRTPTDCVPRAREPGPPESRWPLERRRKGTAAGVTYRLRAGPGRCGGRRCRLRQAGLVEGRWAGGWARPPAARACGVPRHRGYRASQPKTTCSPESDCLGSGRRIMRNEMSSPIKPARIGIRSAT